MTFLYRFDSEDVPPGRYRDPAFLADTNPLLATHYRWEPKAAAAVVGEELLALLPG